MNYKFNTNSNKRPYATLTLHGRKVHFIGNTAMIESLDNEEPEIVIQGSSAAGLILDVNNWFKIRGCAPTTNADIEDELLALIAANQEKYGPEYWQNAIHIQMDFESLGHSCTSYFNALFSLWGSSKVEFREGLSRIRMRRD